MLFCSHWERRASGKHQQTGSLACIHAAFSNNWCACSVWFNFLGRDFFNALSEKDTERFTQMLIKWLCSLFVGIPVSHHSVLLHSNHPQLCAMPNACTSALPLQVYVLRDYFLSVLSLEWREWMTNEFSTDYFKDRAFYQVQAGALVDNPDQRITNDVR